MEEELVSIIVTAYNAQEYVKRCVRAIKKQTYTNYEAIFINDGSNDSTLKVLENEVHNDKRFEVYSQKNSGISSARNLGIEKARGKYIVFVDIDDYVFDDYVEYLYKLIKKYNVKISTCTHQSINPGGKIKVIKEPKDYVISTKDYFMRLGNNELPFQLGVAPWGRMYDKKLFDNIKYPIGKKFEDSATTYKLYLEAGNTAIGESIKYLYFRNENSIVQKAFSKERLQFLEAEKEMTEELAKKFPDISISMERRYRYALMNTLAHIVIAPNANDFKNIQIEIKKQMMRNFNKELFDRKNSKKDILGLISLRMGLPVYSLAFRVFKIVQKKF
ncbi:glycosyltransferase [Pediococcus acidilactici]|uniref:glycosyltransferase family 2 protein n=1 Tax=Pediococcus acidilactici TaxID=1254 RepID=UPI000FFCC6B2|nr:glycosyltransferase family 2 protein [Pediococcus acidilactici]KAF0493153.1 glycosyltransferase [Pediococcus acidilactici]MCJ2192753.1 glycosyltransferase [Pediococcus acidilactici]MWB53000.1 glycosyltransferase [Pediococcus acidilactici]QAR70715.1 glycosyltransferase [Pediococcus acidilactici]